MKVLKTSQGKKNKTKGSNAERYYAKFFREELGFVFCKTSRQSNRMLDDAGIDLNFLPFNVQIKAGYAKGLNEFKTLSVIRERLPTLFPSYDPVHKQVDILIHKKDIGRGNKKDEYSELVFLWHTDFFKIFKSSKIKICKTPFKIGQKRGWNFKEELEKSDSNMLLYSQKGELPYLIVMSFTKFSKLIKNEKWD